MNALGYQVANFSQRELQHGYEAFLRRQKKAQFEFISANIVWQDTGEPVVAPAAIRKVTLREGAKARDVRIGFIGLTQNNPAFLKEGPGGRRIVTIDPLVAAEKQVPSLRQKADVIVALAALDLDQARLLPKKAKDIDLVLGGSGPQQTRNDDFPEDTQIGKARVFFVGDQGKFLGEVRLFFNAQKAIASTQRSSIGLSREWPEDPSLQKVMEATKLAVNDYNRAQAESVSPFRTGPAQAEQVSYTGSERCGACHAQEYASWQRSKHSQAFVTLEHAHQDFNPQCVGCHTIGYGKPGGFVNTQATPRFVNVGCESCHGPSSRHPEPSGKGYGGTDTIFCVTCHTRENSPDFDPATYVPKVRHWDEAKTGR